MSTMEYENENGRYEGMIPVSHSLAGYKDSVYG